MIRALILFLLVPILGHAETVPATFQTAAVQNKVAVNSNNTPYDSGEAACTAARPGRGYLAGATIAPNYAGTYDGSDYGRTCNDNTTISGDPISMHWVFVCPAGYSRISGQGTCQSAQKACPGTDWQLSSDGLTCTRQDCRPDQERGSNGQCQCKNGAQTGTDGTCCPVSGSGGGAPMQWCMVGSPSATSCNSAGPNGCNVRCNNVTFQTKTGDQVAVFPRMALGQNCSFTGTKSTANTDGGPLTNDELSDIDKSTKNPEKAKTPAGCLASGQGYVSTSSGTVCVSGGDTGVTEKKETTKKTEGPEGSTETTKQTSSEQGPNGTGTTTTTTTTKNPDGTTTTTTTKTTKNPDGTITEEKDSRTTNPDGSLKGQPSKENSNNDPGEYCKANPDSPLCKGQTDQCKDHPDRIGCMSAGELPDGQGIGTEEKGVSSIGIVHVGSNATCPADLPLPKGMSFSFQPYCDYASAFRPLIILLAWITAGFMVFGYRGNNG